MSAVTPARPGAAHVPGCGRQARAGGARTHQHRHCGEVGAACGTLAASSGARIDPGDLGPVRAAGVGLAGVQGVGLLVVAVLAHGPEVGGDLPQFPLLGGSAGGGGEGVAAQFDDGARAVIVTLGSDGCLTATPAGHLRVPAPSVNVLDTTGCGDAFSAAFIRGKLLGWNDEAAAKLACAAGSLVATGLGSDAGIVDLQSTITAMPTASRP